MDSSRFLSSSRVHRPPCVSFSLFSRRHACRTIGLASSKNLKKKGNNSKRRNCWSIDSNFVPPILIRVFTLRENRGVRRKKERCYLCARINHEKKGGRGGIVAQFPLKKKLYTRPGIPILNRLREVFPDFSDYFGIPEPVPASKSDPVFCIRNDTARVRNNVPSPLLLLEIIPNFRQNIFGRRGRIERNEVGSL